jgi:hypothetical protein
MDIVKQKETKETKIFWDFRLPVQAATRSRECHKFTREPVATGLWPVDLC